MAVTRIECIRWIGEILLGRVADAKCALVPPKPPHPDPHRWQRLHFSWEYQYVVWLQPIRDYEWKFSSAYPAPAADMGLVHSSAAPDITTLILNRLRQDGDLESGISPSFLVRNWPAMKEWQTQSVRDAFFASPKFPRLLSADAIRDTISRGVANGLLAYVGKTGNGDYRPFVFS